MLPNRHKMNSGGAGCFFSCCCWFLSGTESVGYSQVLHIILLPQLAPTPLLAAPVLSQPLKTLSASLPWYG
ncbi:hypothetical protein KCP70_23875 [Salmonella enterica subsp. enterica]|nr:hypothetical protein KCP70_23875 [Salmonella enterica subsp. enterica]